MFHNLLFSAYKRLVSLCFNHTLQRSFSDEGWEGIMMSLEISLILHLFSIIIIAGSS